MIILIVTLDKNSEQMKKCLFALLRFTPTNVLIETIEADPHKTKVAEEIYQKYVDECDEDIMIWHPDMIALEGWYDQLMKYYDYFDVPGMKLIYPNKQIQHFGGSIIPDGRGCHPHQNHLDIGLTKPLDCAYVTCPGMIIKKKVSKVIRWDFQFNQYIDVDFCFQAREAGFTVGVIPVTLIHEEGIEGWKTRSQFAQAQMLIENHHKFVAKWMEVLSKLK